MNRRDFQALAEIRLKEAQLLFEGRQFDGGYYLAGYAIECALKACIAKKTKRHDFPDKELAQSAFTHDLTQLLKLAGLTPNFQHEFGKDKAFERQWTIVKDWNERSRYEKHGRNKARSLLDVITGAEGVLAWIKRFW